MEKEFIKYSLQNYLILKKDSFNDLLEIRKILRMLNNIIKNLSNFYSFHKISKLIFKYYFNLNLNKKVEVNFLIKLFCYSLENIDNKYNKIIKKLENDIYEYCNLMNNKIIDNLISNSINDFLLDNWNDRLYNFIEKICIVYNLKNMKYFLFKNLKKTNEKKIEDINSNQLNSKKIDIIDCNNYYKEKITINKINNNKIKKENRSYLKSYLNKYIIKKKKRNNLIDNSSFININSNSDTLNSIINENNIHGINNTINLKNDLIINNIDNFSVDFTKINDIFNNKDIN